MRVRLTDIRDHSVQEFELSSEARTMAGWQSGVTGWSIGEKGSGAPIELDEPLGECHVGVFTGTFQVLLWGMAKELPDIWLLPQGRATGGLLPFEPERWLKLGRRDLHQVAMKGDVYLRFDQSPVRFGNYILENLNVFDSAVEYCASCSEILRTYFRVGSQQVCPACTEKFKLEMSANRDRYYRLAVRDGIVAAIAGGVIHAALLAYAHLSFGSTLIGILVGIAIRRASRESAESRHQWTALVLTFLAGSLPLGWGMLRIGPPIFLAIGMFAAWKVSSRNVRTQIHGPFQAKTDTQYNLRNTQ